MVAELLGYVLSARTCTRGSAGAVANVGVVQAVVAIALALMAVVGLVIAIGNWKTVREGSVSDRSAVWGRAEFMSMAGIVASVLFVLCIVLFAVAPLLVNACRQAR
jgi:hypothetical protein